MIITRTPVSLTLCGHGSDHPDNLKDLDYGAVCTIAINKYVYVVAKEAPLEAAAEQENYDQAVLKDCEGLLGTGHSQAVGQTHARSLILDTKVPTKQAMASRASVQGPGHQGIYFGAAFGGISYTEFGTGVEVEPLILDPKRESLFLQHLKLYHVGAPQGLEDPLTQTALLSTRNRALACSIAWAQGSPKDLGDLLRSEWLDRPSFWKDTLEVAIPSAWGMALFGEYLLVAAPLEIHKRKPKLPMKPIPFAIDWKGSTSFYCGE